MQQIIAALDQAGFGGTTATDGRGASVRLQEFARRTFTLIERLPSIPPSSNFPNQRTSRLCFPAPGSRLCRFLGQLCSPEPSKQRLPAAFLRLQRGGLYPLLTRAAERSWGPLLS